MRFMNDRQYRFLGGSLFLTVAGKNDAAWDNISLYPERGWLPIHFMLYLSKPAVMMRMVALCAKRSLCEAENYFTGAQTAGLDHSHREHLYPLYLIAPVDSFSTFAMTSDSQSGQCFAISS
jgi:hypothetical protein